MRKVVGWFIQGLEFLLAFLFIQGGIRTITVDELPDVPGILGLAAEYHVVVGYGILWVCAGIALILGKIFKFRRLHGYSLMVMYLSCVYVLVLSLLIDGVKWELLTTLAVAFASGGLYLRWKYKIAGRDYERTD